MSTDNRLYLDARVLAAARLFAAKQDSRTYIEGVHFNAAKQRIEATNGHVAIAIPFTPPAGFESAIYRMPKGSLGKFCALDGDTLHTFDDERYTLAKDRYVLESIPGQFPDTDRVFPADGCTTGCGHFALNAGYLALLAKAFGASTVMEFFVAHKKNPVLIRPQLVDPHPLAQARVVIMPCSL